jgi:molybdopterin-containing oxidoreductase family membrane subunit
MDFAGGQVPGWHSTIFPPYFVAGAIFSGFAMVLTLAIPLRAFYGLKDFVTIRHIDNCAKLMLVTGLIVGYGYMTELFMGWYSGSEFEQYVTVNRMAGKYAWSYWLLILCNVLIPQAMWSRKIRQSVFWMFIISIIVNIGMWLERFVIIVTSLSEDFMPSAWRMYYPTFWDFSTFIGSIGLFLCLFLLFIRFLPVISIFEMRELVHGTSEEESIQEEVDRSA